MAIDSAALQRNLAYVAIDTIPRLQADLEELADLDRTAEVARQKFQKRLTISLLVSVVSFIASFPSFGAALILLIPAVAIAIHSGYQLRSYRRLDFPNHRYRLLQRLVELLARDMTARSSLEVQLDLSPPDEKVKRTGETPYPGRPRWKITHYRDPWLIVQGRWVDGTRFHLTLTQEHQVRSGRNPKGKQKVKPRFKGIDLTLVLTCPDSMHQVLPTLKNPSTALRLPPQARAKALRVTDRGMVVKAHLPGQAFANFVPASFNLAVSSGGQTAQAQVQAEQDLEDGLYQTIAMMFLSAAQVVNLARATVRQQQIG